MIKNTYINLEKVAYKYFESIDSEEQDKTFKELIKTYNNAVQLYSADDDVCSVDVGFILGAIERIIKYKYKGKRAEIEYLQSLKDVIRYRMIDAISIQNTLKYGKRVYISDPICYMDQNVLARYIRGEDIGYNIPEGVVVPYSPAHIAEISKSCDDFLQLQDLKLISSVTKNIELLFTSESFTLFEENPEMCLKRVSDGSYDIDLAQEYKYIENKIIKLRFEDDFDQDFRMRINGTDPESFIENNYDLVNKLLSNLYVSCDLDDIKRKGNTYEYNILNEYIHALSTVFDICGFQRDKEAKKIRSSRIDIEHILYGSAAQIFLTYDRRLRLRAINIYKALGKEVLCPKVHY